MMKNLIIISSCIFLFTACAANKKQSSTGMPQCMVSKIESMKSDPQINAPKSVIQYFYNGATVFYITAGCCDQYNPVYSKDCVYLGAPDGGITGKGDGKLPDFYANATEKKIVWEEK